MQSQQTHRVRDTAPLGRGARTRLLPALVLTVLIGCTGAEPDQVATSTEATTSEAATEAATATPPPQGPVASTYRPPRRMREVRDDGLTWQRIGFDQPPLAREQRDEVIDLSGDADLLVAGGRRGAAAGAWTSRDGGESWVTMQGFGAGGTGSADVVTVLEDGTISLAGAEVDDPSIASAWFWRGGARVRNAPLDEARVAGGYPYGMVETPSGLVLLDNGVRVWRSDQGRAWDPVAGPDGQPLLLAPLHLPTGPVRLDDGSLVALAIADTVQLLRSNDDGQTWSATALDAPALTGAHLRRMVQTPDGALLAVGFRLVDGDAAEEALVVRSEDQGETWQVVELDGEGGSGVGRQLLTSAVVLGDDIFVVGTAGNQGDRWPGAWQSTDDGQSWTPIHPGEGVAPRGAQARNQGDSFEDAVVVGDDLVVVGHRDDGQRRDVTVWRLITQD